METWVVKPRMVLFEMMSAPLLAERGDATKMPTRPAEPERSLPVIVEPSFTGVTITMPLPESIESRLFWIVSDWGSGPSA